MSRGPHRLSRSRSPALPRPDLLSTEWPLTALAAALLMLAAAHGFEAFGYAPCDLCLRQRDVYWLTVAAAALGAVGVRLRPEPGVRRGVCALIGLLFALECALAVYHAGVEWHWWPGPTGCSGRRVQLEGRDLNALLAGARVHAVRCDAAAWRLAGVSMAGWNALISGALTAASFVQAAGSGRRRLG